MRPPGESTEKKDDGISPSTDLWMALGRIDDKISDTMQALKWHRSVLKANKTETGMAMDAILAAMRLTKVLIEIERVRLVDEQDFVS